MICYPLSILILADIRGVLFIFTLKDICVFERIFGDIAQIGMKFGYVVHKVPKGLDEAFSLSTKNLLVLIICVGFW